MPAPAPAAVPAVGNGRPAGATVAAPPSGPAEAAPQAEDPVEAAVVGIVERLTGYPRDLLDLDLDLEADLGVDTVKQAEVFAAVREQFGIPSDDNLKLREFPTLAHVIRLRPRAGKHTGPGHGRAARGSTRTCRGTCRGR